MDLSELWKSTPAVSAAVVAVAGALYKAMKTLLEFNDEYLSKRQFKRHSFLRGEAEQHRELTAFIEAARHEAVFRSTFGRPADRKSTRLNSSHVRISYAVFCLKKKKKNKINSNTLMISSRYDEIRSD